MFWATAPVDDPPLPLSGRDSALLLGCHAQRAVQLDSRAHELLIAVGVFARLTDPEMPEAGASTGQDAVNRWVVHAGGGGGGGGGRIS